jgi:FkbM family methyltransferase
MELAGIQASLIFDVGAHEGLAAVRYRELFPGAKIYCFEPFPESFDRLSAAVSDCQPIELHQIALAETNGEASFSVNRNSATNSLLAADSNAAIYWRGDTPMTTGHVAVRTETLDAFCSARAITAIDVLKMDVQGGEFDVLQGAQGLLAQQAVGLVYMELIMAPTYVGQHRPREYLELFDRFGYELFDLYNFGRSDGRLLQTDVIFISPQVLASYEARLAR